MGLEPLPITAGGFQQAFNFLLVFCDAPGMGWSGWIRGNCRDPTFSLRIAFPAEGKAGVCGFSLGSS